MEEYAGGRYEEKGIECRATLRCQLSECLLLGLRGSRENEVFWLNLVGERIITEVKGLGESQDWEEQG